MITDLRETYYVQGTEFDDGMKHPLIHLMRYHLGTIINKNYFEQLISVLPYTDVCMKHCRPTLGAFRVSAEDQKKHPLATWAGFKFTTSCLLL